MAFHLRRLKPVGRELCRPHALPSKKTFDRSSFALPNQLGSARRARHELREAGHPSTDHLDLNVRWMPWPHEARQTEADKLGAQTPLHRPTKWTRKRRRL
jgi:hypothetical protein